MICSRRKIENVTDSVFILWDSSPPDSLSWRIGQRNISPFSETNNIFSSVFFSSPVYLFFPQDTEQLYIFISIVFKSPLAKTERKTAMHFTLLHDLVPSCANIHCLEKGEGDEEERMMKRWMDGQKDEAGKAACGRGGGELYIIVQQLVKHSHSFPSQSTDSRYSKIKPAGTLRHGSGWRIRVWIKDSQNRCIVQKLTKQK